MGLRSEASLFSLGWLEFYDILDGIAWYQRKINGIEEPAEPADVAKKEEWLRRAAERDREMERRNGTRIGGADNT